MGVHVFYASPEGWGAWYGAQTTHSSRSSIFVSSLWVAVPEMDFLARKHLCLSCPFYPLSYSPSFQLFFLEGIVPFVVEDLAVFLWDGEFRIFLCFLAWTNQFNSGQLLSHVGFFVTPRTAACQAFLSITNSWSLLRLMSIEFVIPFNHLILCWSLLLLPSIFASIRVFNNESVLWIRWPKAWSFSFSISPSNEYSVLISFRIEWFDLLEVQGTLKSLL